MTPRRVAVTAKNTVCVEPFELPAIGDGQVLVESEYSTISPGTELAFLTAMPNASVRFPWHPGYSSSGVIVKLGPEVQDLSVGQRAAVWINHCSHAVVPAHRVRPIPESVTSLDASPFRLGSIALQGIRKAQIQLGDDVAVVGLGPIGNLALQLARGSGAARVTGIDPVPHRRDIALECGTDHVAASLEELPENEYDVVIEATGRPQVIPPSFRLARKRGRVVLLGSTRGVTSRIDFYRDVHKKGLTILGAHESIRPASDDHTAYCTHATDENVVLKLLAAERLRTRPLISDTMPADEAQDAYTRLQHHNESILLIALAWR